MNETVLRQLVSEWLEGPAFPAFTRRRVAAPDLSRLRSILAIAGPRRSGKTFFMVQLMKDLLDRSRCRREDILFIDFEDYRLLDFKAEDMGALFAAFRQAAGRAPTYLFFDEIQHLRGWSRVLRTLHNRGTYHIVVSGSNSELLGREIATELRGRTQDVLMLPFSFREALAARGIDVSATSAYTERRGAILGVFDSYLAHGGFPEVLHAGSAAEQRRILQDYFRTLYYRDIVDRYHVRARHVLDAMMHYGLSVYGDLFSVSGFAKDLSREGGPASKRTIANYLRYLADAFFLIINEKFSYSPNKRIMNPKKIYLLDTGFALLSVEFSENRGKRIENAVAVELLRRGRQMFYHAGRRECDFVIVEGRKPIQAIQVAWELSPRNRDRETAGLDEAMRTFGIREGLILTYDEEDEFCLGGRPVRVRPAWRWMCEEAEG